MKKKIMKKEDGDDNDNNKAHDKMRSGADLNNDNLWISRAYLRISDYCRVTVRVMVGFRVANCCIQT